MAARAASLRQYISGGIVVLFVLSCVHVPLRLQCDAFSTPAFRWPTTQSSRTPEDQEDAEQVLSTIAQSTGIPFPSSMISLFRKFGGVEVSSSDPIYVARAARMAKMAGDIYEAQMKKELYELGETVVANGTSADVAWVVTDGIDANGNNKEPGRPLLVRTITIRGYHAADNQVDRLRLLNALCYGAPVSVDPSCDIEVHSGLWNIANELYKDLSPYLTNLSKQHKIVFNGHSIGGALSVLCLIRMCLHLGINFVKENVLHVYTFGSPPVTRLRERKDDPGKHSHGDVLKHLNLPSTLVKGYVQPWDPIARIYSSIDSLYPLVDDVDIDGVTLWKSGPPRTLRPFMKKLLESWKEWPQTLEKCSTTLDQDFIHVGVQHILLPDSIRYMTDRLMAVNIGVPPTDSIIRIPNAKNLLPALEAAFPLDTFTISTVPVAVRSFVHHFYPAYGIPLASFVNKQEKLSAAKQEQVMNESTMLPSEIIPEDIKDIVEEGANNMFKIEWAEIASEWVLGGGFRGDSKAQKR